MHHEFKNFRLLELSNFGINFFLFLFVNFRNKKIQKLEILESFYNTLNFLYFRIKDFLITAFFLF